jgi:hypothetical protein
MSWVYANWQEQATDALALAALKQHMTEVSQRISASVTADGKSVDTSTLNEYLRWLGDERQRLETRASASEGTRRSLARF